MTVIFLLLLVAAFIWLILHQVSHRLMFKPERHVPYRSPSFDHDVDWNDAQFEASDGVALHGWYCKKRGNSMTLLLCHGNTGSISGREKTVELYLDMGLNVLLFDYRGYGLSNGTPSEKGTYLDARAAWTWLRQNKGLPADKIMVLGRSLGGAVAARMVADLSETEQPAGVVIESTFASLPELATELYSPLARMLRAFIHYPTRSVIGRIRSPLLIVHSSEDDLIDIRHGKELHAAAPEGTLFLEITGTHRDGFATSQATYRPALADFLRHCGLVSNN